MYHQSSGSLQTIRMFVNLVGKTEPITDEEDAAEYIWFCKIYVCVQNQTYSVASATAVTGSILCGNRELAIIGHNKVVLNIVSISQRFSHRKPENTDPINRKFEQNFEKCLCFITRGSTVQFISQKMGGSKYFLLYGNQMKKSLMGVHLFVPK